MALRLLQMTARACPSYEARTSFGLPLHLQPKADAVEAGPTEICPLEAVGSDAVPLTTSWLAASSLNHSRMWGLRPRRRAACNGQHNCADEKDHRRAHSSNIQRGHPTCNPPNDSLRRQQPISA